MLLYRKEHLGYKKLLFQSRKFFMVSPIVPQRRLFRLGLRLLCAGIIFLALVYGTVALLVHPVLPPVGHAVADRILVEKSARRLTLYQDGEVIASYPVSLGRGGLALKRREGDKLTPEGTYKISGRNPRSSYHLSLRISYPDDADKKRAAEAGVSAGSDIMIHGIRNGFGWLGVLHRMADWTQGCVALTNAEMRQVWNIVPDGAVIEIRP